MAAQEDLSGWFTVEWQYTEQCQFDFVWPYLFGITEELDSAWCQDHSKSGLPAGWQFSTVQFSKSAPSGTLFAVKE